MEQRKQECFSPSSLGFYTRLGWDFFTLLLSSWTLLRSCQSSAKQQILWNQIAPKARAKYYKKTVMGRICLKCKSTRSGNSLKGARTKVTCANFFSVTVSVHFLFSATGNAGFLSRLQINCILSVIFMPREERMKRKIGRLIDTDMACLDRDSSWWRFQVFSNESRVAK